MMELDVAFKEIQAVAWGSLPFEVVRPKLSPDGLALVEKNCSNPKTVLIAAFPYYGGAQEGNISLYARGQDYHTVVTGLLTTVVNDLLEAYPTERFWVGADNSPLPELDIAFQAGLGLRGKHGLLIVPPYGSYLFLGTIVTSVPLALPIRAPAPDCVACGACTAHCPTGARGEGSFAEEHCLSHITQRKGELSPYWVERLTNHPLIWGCDICQQVCPYNKEVPITPIKAFRSDLMATLTPEDLEGLTNRTFQEKYGQRAFAWRGPQVLRRNLRYKYG